MAEHWGAATILAKPEFCVPGNAALPSCAYAAAARYRSNMEHPTDDAFDSCPEKHLLSGIALRTEAI